MARKVGGKPGEWAVLEGMGGKYLKEQRVNNSTKSAQYIGKVSCKR